VEIGRCEPGPCCASFEIDQSASIGTPPKPCEPEVAAVPGDWAQSLAVLLIAFVVAFVYKIIAELVEVDGEQVLASFPVFSWLGWKAASAWGWVLYPSPGYIGQGMVRGIFIFNS